MNTPAHLLLGAAAFGKGRRGLIWAALAGGLLPDLSLYLMAGGSLYLLDIPPRTVFGELYYSDLWQGVFAVDNSVFVWGALLALASWRRSGWGVALTAAALLHLALDFPLHHDDGRAHFWPLTGWIFESPVSYWDRRHGAQWLAPIEAVLCVVAAIRIWAWRPGWAIGTATALLLLAELMVGRVWGVIFG